MTNSIHLIQGDMLECLPELPENSFDSCVTDAPYEIGFMGRAWDSTGIAFQPDAWSAVLRVLKPGAHLLAFGGTRGFHRMACAIEDAGFEIRDTLAWVYGTGFPKGQNIAKAIAKRRTEDHEPVRTICRAIRAAMDDQNLTSRDIAPHFNCHSRLVDHWAARDTDSQPSLPTPQQWDALKSILKLGNDLDPAVNRLNQRKGTHGQRWSEAPIVGEQQSGPLGFGELRFSGDRSIRSLDPEAQQWEGWGTALKPAYEPIILARKPLIGTVAVNVLEYGTGGINIDACRVPTDVPRPQLERRKDSDLDQTRNCFGTGLNGSRAVEDTMQGRFPANLIHDGSDEVVECFPDGSSRFFYSAKASKSDRDEGNDHPTVKPTELMRYLCRLITPTGGMILDPFMGSGSTGKAAALEGFDFTGIELDPHYLDIAESRIRAVH